MNPFEMTKAVLGLGGYVGSTAIVRNIIIHTTPESTSKITKVCISGVGYVVGALANKKVYDYMSAEIDKVESWVKEFPKKQKPAKVEVVK